MMVTWLEVVLLAVLASCPHQAHARIGTFWHVSDFHLDPNYTVTGVTDNMCWDRERVRRQSRGEARAPGEFGDYECDAPLALVKSAVAAMANFQPNPDFILWTGDDTAHVDDKFFSSQTVVQIIALLTDELHRAFPNTIVFPVLGNHDYFPKNQIPPGESEIQTQVAGLWSRWFSRSALDSFKAGGRYWEDVEGSNVTVVAVNTLIWYKNNLNTALLPDDDPLAKDPDGQFQWLDDVLKQLAARKRKVYVIGHIPPGTFERYQQTREGFHWYQPRYNTRFMEVVRQHASVIEAQFFAHHHTDSFRLFFNDDMSQEARSPVSYQLLAPGVTPWRSTLSKETGANNPGIRLVSYDTITGEVTEVSTYYLDLKAANRLGRAEWELEYNFTFAYNLKAINPTTLYNLAKKLRNDQLLFDRYYTANTVSLDYSVCFTMKCRRLHWCAITEVNYKRFYECNSAMRLSCHWAFCSILAILLALVAR